MPSYGRKKKRYGSRRRYRRRRVYRRRYGSRRSSYKRIIRRRFNRKTKYFPPRRTIWPDQLFAKLRFNDYTSITSAAGTLGQTTYRGNSPYDPNPSVGGDSAYGFPDYAGVYGNYVCYGSKITCKVYNNNSTGVDGIFSIVPTKASGGVSNGTDYTSGIWTSWQNMRYQKWKMCGSVVGGSGANKIWHKVSNYMSLTKFFGVSKQKIRDDDIYTATITANPGTQFYWALTFFDANKAAAITSCIVEVQITYYVKFWTADATDQ